MTRFVNIIFILTLLSNCNGRVNNQVADQENSPITDFEISKYDYKTDTLSIICNSEFLYYPFGKFSSRKDFMLRHPYLKSQVKYISDHDSVYLMNHDQSHVYLFLNNRDSPEYRLEVISADIKEKDIVLQAKISIGLSILDFVRIIKLSVNDLRVREIKVIELISELDGVWHYYVFEKEHLKFIYIRTDYQFDI